VLKRVLLFYSLNLINEKMLSWGRTASTQQGDPQAFHKTGECAERN
jgi:hypothetical protein